MSDFKQPQDVSRGAVFEQIAAHILEHKAEAATWHVAAVMFPIDATGKPDYEQVHTMSSFGNKPSLLLHCAEIMAACAATFEMKELQELLGAIPCGD